MKNIYLIGAIISILLFSSCSTTHTLTINGTPGNVISEKAYIDEDAIGVIDNTGNINIELKRKLPYKPFLFSIDPKTQKATPFALDFNISNKMIAPGSASIGGCALMLLSSASESIPLMILETVLSQGGLWYTFWGQPSVMTLTSPILTNRIKRPTMTCRQNNK